MAIPVSNPPPRYEPTPPSASELPQGPSPPSQPRGPDLRVRGCIVLLGVAGAIGCVASIALALSCRGCMQMGEAEGTRRIAVSYRAAAVAADEASRDEADLRTLEQLGNTGELSIMAFGILNNRFNDAIANDGTIDADELHHGMELVHDVVVGNGSVDMNRYPNGR